MPTPQEIYNAIIGGNPNTIQMINATPVDQWSTARDADGKTLLHEAVLKNRMDVAK
jgi:hypothetical protein